MNFDTQQALDKLQQAVVARDYDGYSGKDWQDYDVTVCVREDEAVTHWRKLPSRNIHEFQRLEPHRRVVATRYAHELSWLFEQLRSIHPNEIERHTHHDFYAELADSANRFIAEKKASVTAPTLLEEVLQRVRTIYR